LGSGASAAGLDATAAGAGASASGNNAAALGAGSLASGMNSAAFGAGAIASGSNAVAFGAGAQATATNSVAIGAGSMATFMNTVSVGSVGNYRRVVNVADPIDAHDAVTLGYLQNNYSGNDAISDLSHQIDALNKQVASLTGDSVGTDANAATAEDAGVMIAPSRDAEQSAVTSSSAAAQGSAVDGPVASDSDTVAATPAGTAAPPASDATDPASAAEATQANPQVAEVASTANVYTDRQTEEALQSARTYTDASTANAVSQAKAYTDQALAGYVTSDTFDEFRQQMADRFDATDERINRTSAMSTAMVQMAASASGIDTANRVGVGYGNTHGRSALAVGYQRAVGKNATITIGGSVSGSESSVGAGVGFGW
jgi:autotransporter adhesin